MPKNPSEAQSKGFEKGERIRFEDVKVGMIVKVRILNSAHKEEKFEGIVESLEAEVKPSDLPRGSHLQAATAAAFYVTLKDGTARVVWENEVKDIEFRGQDEKRKKAEVSGKPVVDIAPGPGREKLANQLKAAFKKKHGRDPSDAELEKMIREFAQIAQNALKDKDQQEAA